MSSQTNDAGFIAGSPALAPPTDDSANYHTWKDFTEAPGVIFHQYGRIKTPGRSPNTVFPKEQSLNNVIGEFLYDDAMTVEWNMDFFLNNTQNPFCRDVLNSPTLKDHQWSHLGDNHWTNSLHTSINKCEEQLLTCVKTTLTLIIKDVPQLKPVIDIDETAEQICQILRVAPKNFTCRALMLARISRATRLQRSWRTRLSHQCVSRSQSTSKPNIRHSFSTNLTMHPWDGGLIWIQTV